MILQRTLTDRQTDVKPCFLSTFNKISNACVVNEFWVFVNYKGRNYKFPDPVPIPGVFFMLHIFTF